MTKDLSKADANDEALTIDEMLHNSANWDFAADIIRAGEVEDAKLAEIAEKFPDFWLTYMAKAEGASKTDRSVN
jgi:hypothetical protein